MVEVSSLGIPGLDSTVSLSICLVADASPCVGAAAWWHDWKEDQFQELACALMAGHLIECTGYCTGANFTGFKRFPKNVRTGFPIAEISSDGDVVITKASFFDAEVSVESELLPTIHSCQGQSCREQTLT